VRRVHVYSFVLGVNGLWGRQRGQKAKKVGIKTGGSYELWILATEPLLYVRYFVGRYGPGQKQKGSRRTAGKRWGKAKVFIKEKGVTKNGSEA